MKSIKMTILFICLFLVSNQLSATNVGIVDIQNKELIIVPNYSETNTFSTYYVFQYENIDFSFFANYQSISFQSATNEELTLLCDGQNVILSIKENFIGYKGYGFSKRTGSFSLKSPLSETGTILDVVVRDGIPPAQEPNVIHCYSGGVGSIECSASTSIAGVSSDCSVKCSPGYYACCDDKKNECKCIANPSHTTLPTGTVILPLGTIVKCYGF